MNGALCRSGGVLVLLLVWAIYLCPNGCRRWAFKKQVRQAGPVPVVREARFSPVQEATNELNLRVNDTCFRAISAWRQSYAPLHARVLHGAAPSRYAVAVLPEAGTADRLTGFLTLFYYALFTSGTSGGVVWASATFSRGI